MPFCVGVLAEGGELASLVADAPSVDVARQVWRHLDALAAGTDDPSAGVAASSLRSPS